MEFKSRIKRHANRKLVTITVRPATAKTVTTVLNEYVRTSQNYNRETARLLSRRLWVLMYQASFDRDSKPRSTCISKHWRDFAQQFLAERLAKTEWYEFRLRRSIREMLSAMDQGVVS